jgi:molecular chaperone DnaK (HSP70)
VADGWTLAIDFGACFSTAAIASSGQVSLLEVDNSNYLPSLVCLDEDGSLLTGAAALRRAAVLPDHAERMPKRSLVRSAEVRLGSRTVACTDLVAAVVGRMYHEARAHQNGRPPKRVVLTHPADWQDQDLALLLKAAQAAGLTSPTLLPEPIAAALYYSQNEKPFAAGRGDHLAIYDLGGYTCDVNVLRLLAAGTRFELAAQPGGVMNLGGEDLTEALLKLVRGYAWDRDPQPWDDMWRPVDDPAGARQQAAVRRTMGKAKEALSRSRNVLITVPGYPEEFRIGRREYQAAIEDILKRTISSLEATVASAGLVPAGLAGILLSGGASHTPFVGDLLAQWLGRPPEIPPGPKPDFKAVVALGALAATAPGLSQERREWFKVDKDIFGNE